VLLKHTDPLHVLWQTAIMLPSNSSRHNKKKEEEITSTVFTDSHAKNMKRTRNIEEAKIIRQESVKK